MKKLLLIFCFPIFLIGSENEYQNFDENTFIELVEKIVGNRFKKSILQIEKDMIRNML